MALVKEVKPRATQVTTTSALGNVQEDLNALDMRVGWLSTPEAYGAKGDGVTDDTAALNSTFSNSSGVVVFPPNKVYKVTGPINASAVRTLQANGSVIKLSGTPSSTVTVLSFGKAKGSISSLSVAVSAGAVSLTVPGIGAIAAVGDLLSLRSSTVRVGASESNYLYGQRCVIKSISGDTVTLVEPIHEGFTVTSCSVHAGGAITLSGLVLDLTDVGSTTSLVEGVAITGVGITVEACSILGSSYCSAGLVVQGCVADIRGSTITGFLNANGVSSGGRTGYGIYLDCNNTTVDACTLSGSKHQLTCASRSFVMKGLTVSGNTVSSADTPTSEATLDLHANVVGVPEFSGNTIFADKAAFGIRNGGARMVDNTIICKRDAEATPALIGLDEYPNVYYIEIARNQLDCSSNLRLLSLGELQSVDNVTIEGNRGTIGSILDQAMNVGSLSNWSIADNRLSGMTKIINANRRSAASTQTMFSLCKDLRLSGNVFECTGDTLSAYVLNLWTHANTAVGSKLELRDVCIVDNRISCLDTPVLLDFVKVTGTFVFDRNVLQHTVTASPVTPPTQFSAVFVNCNLDDAKFRDNSMPGMLRFQMLATQAASSTSYPDETCTWKLDIIDNAGFGVSFEKNANAGHVVVIADSQVHGNKFRHLYGAPVGFVTSPSNVWGSNTGVIDIADNVLITGATNAVGIGTGWGTHNIVVRNNLVAGAIQDSSTAKVAPVNNTSITP